MIFYLGSIVLIAIGFYVIFTKKNLMKIIIGMGLADTGVNMLLVSVGYVEGGTAPIQNGAYTSYVDPIPQALVLTAIVIGTSVMALAVSVVIGIYRKFGSVEMDDIKGEVE